MTRKEVLMWLARNGFKKLCEDGKTLVAYREIQKELKEKRCALRDITSINYDHQTGHIVVTASFLWRFVVNYSLEDDR